MKNLRVPILLIVIILVIDQIIKIYVKTHFRIGDEFLVFGLDWFRIHFLENKGMAFGMSFGGSMGKLILTFCRLVLAVFIFIYMKKISNNKDNKMIVYAFSLIFAGAVGNIIDSMFYGLMFSESTPFLIAEFSPQTHYAHFLCGKVVDMFYFPIIETTLPEWLPIVGGNDFRFFNAIFNFADASITIGVCLLIISAFVKRRLTSKTTEDSTLVSEQNI